MFFQHVLKLIDAVAQRLEVAHIEYLAADMEVQTEEINVFHLFSPPDNGKHIPHSYAEFVLSETGCYIGMRVRVYVRVDTEAHIGYPVFGLGQFVYDFKLGHAFHIEAENRGFEGQVYFPIGLAYACKDYLFSRESCSKCGLNFPSAHAIGTQTGPCNDAQYFGIGVRFNGIVDMEMPFPRHLCANSLQRFVQQAGVIIIKRCSLLPEFINRKLTFHLLSVLYQFCRLYGNFNILR